MSAIRLKLRESSPISSELFTVARSSYFPLVKSFVLRVKRLIGAVRKSESPTITAALTQMTMMNVVVNRFCISCFSSMTGVIFLAFKRNTDFPLCVNLPVTTSQYASERFSMVYTSPCSSTLSSPANEYPSGKVESMTLSFSVSAAV